MLNNIICFDANKKIRDEDLCGLFNYLWSAIVLAAMGDFVTILQYAGHPISCWCPAEMPEVQCNYTKALCWVKQNYYVHEDQDIVVNQQEIYSESIAYYPWVPWILFFMAAMLKFPHYIWQSFAHTSGLNLVKLIEMADTHDDIETLAKILQIWLIRTCLSTNSKCDGLRHFLGSIGFFWLGKRQRTYLAGLVLFIKLTYLVVSVGLHLSLNFFIDEDFMWYGYEVFENYLRGIPQFSARFPAQTLCDMEVRESTTNVNRYTVQCILPINRYSEKIFIFVWFWLLMLIIINGWSLFKWGIRLLSPSDRRRFVQGYVEITLYLMKMQKRKMMKRFGHDGVVVFRTLEDAVGVIMANQIFQELYVQLNASLHYS
uniref:Innexin n=1 Tax=Lymnaea stagnalis TaxID=6523 RepID=A0A6C0X6W3_LYMST|nr:innexin 8 [Lymnaea stagnalis]